MCYTTDTLFIDFHEGGFIAMRLSIDDDKPQKPLPEPEKIIPFRELSFKQKLEHIWIYYKWKILIPVLSVIAIISISMSLYENFKDSALYAVFLNSEFDDETNQAFVDDFIDYAQLDMKGKKVTLDSSMYIYRKNGTSDTTSLSSNQKLLAMYTSIEMDVIISDQANFDYYAAQGSFSALKEVLPEEFLENHADRLITAKDSEGNDICFGIDISDSQKLKDSNAYKDVSPIILAIPVTHMEDENLLKFIEFLLGE